MKNSIVIYCAVLIFSSCCANNRRNLETTQINIEELKLLAQNCDNVNTLFSTPLEIKPDSTFSYDFKKLQILRYSECFIGKNKNELEQMVGPFKKNSPQYLFAIPNTKYYHMITFIFENGKVVRSTYLTGVEIVKIN